MLKYQNSDTTDTFYIATAIAKQTQVYKRFGINDRRYAIYGYGENLPSSNFMTVYVGFEKGQSDSGQPCWSEHGPTEFAMLEAVQQMAEANLGGGYNFVRISDTIKFHKITRHRTVDYNIKEI